MFYFFERDRAFVSCELRTLDGESYEIHITYPDGSEHVERLADSATLLSRWDELRRGFIAAGWWGPHGRD